MSTGGYPIGAENDPRAPYNEKQLPEREIEVCISVTLSRTAKIKVTDYDIIDSGIDEDGNYYEDLDFSNCNLKSAVENQIELPQDNISLKDWNEDEFEVIEE